MSIDYYDRSGKKITAEECNALLSSNDYRKVAHDTATDKDGKVVRVSTVWLGLDYSLHFHESPIEIFETMAFSDGGRWDMFMMRHSTEKQALEGHKMVLDKIRAESAVLN